MKRVVLAVSDPWNYFNQWPGYSLAIINPDGDANRKQYLLDNLDWSLLVTSDGVQHRDGGDYGNEQMVMYTSGTTGDSKFFSYSTTQVQHVVDNIIASYELTANDRFLSVMPLWHGHGHILNYVVATAGMQVHHVRPPDLKKQIEFSPTWVSAIPDILRVMSRTQKFPDLRFARSASVALPDQVFDDLKTSFNTPIIESFGMSEACSHCFTNPLYGEQRIGTIGLPDGIDADIRNGSLWLRGPQCHTADWFDTEDLAEQDSAGYYKILGRRLDRLNLHGIKLNPLSIENQLYNRIPQLNEVVVFGENKMMCVYTGDVLSSQVRQALTDISTHCNPKFLAQVESIPKNTAGKISRSLLKEIYN
jgi:acyl-coenzyme A synthetase/AMP-(fatty) acid ligase